MSERRSAVVELEARYGRPGHEVLERLRRARLQGGTITPLDVEAIAAELRLPRAHVYGAASFFSDLGFERHGERHIRVCDGTACFAATGGEHVARAGDELPGATVQPVYCLGYCYGGPAALDGDLPHAGPDLLDQLSGRVERRDPEIPYQADVERPVVLEGLAGRRSDPWSAWHRMVRSAAPERVIGDVLDSGLRGRGGAGFPAARKWALAAGTRADQRFVICNGDEGDPGSYVDRLLMERDPQRVLAGLALAGYASGATKGWVYVRSEYPRASEALRRAIEEARADGHLGRRVHGSDFDFDVEVFEGAGSYVAGEETALIHSMEGLRGAVASRPPFPTERGLRNRPTAVNNVETLVAVPWIVRHGGEAYARLGIGESRGTKVVCLNERFERPGVYEVALGESVRRICEELGGGLRDGHRLRSLEVGGPLGGYLPPDRLDVPLTYEALESEGVALGHGSLVAFDERVPGVEVLRHAWRFAAAESCGTCFPCRVGTERGLELAERIRADGPSQGALALQEDLLRTLGTASLCAFGKSVPLPVRTIMRVYSEELAA